MTDGATPHRRDPTRLIGEYRPAPGVADELIDALGSMRPVWSALIDHLSRQSDRVRGGDEGAGVPHGQCTVAQHGLHRIGQLQQA